ncbi:cytochrome P450 [Cladophialophora carrionii]|uniref:Cytochrome P450 n=1 Tax=Cladophialophora carrionii TaxID=86049 RepID=A0A1C1CQR8_9EURO|nr:cytochrome P450 [Cladophialophora carrionii]
MATVHYTSTIQSFIHSHFPSNLTSDVVPASSHGANILFAHKWTLLCLALLTPTIYRVLHFFVVKDQPPKGLRLVPGPGSTIPYIGRVDIDAIAPWNSMKNWSDKFNGLFRLQACGEMHIWLGDNDVAQELYCKRAAIYSSRPEVAAVPGSDSQGQYLPLLEYGVLTSSYNNEYYGYINLEAKRFLFQLLKDPLDHFAQTDRYCGRISARLSYGSPKSAAAHCKNAAEFIPQISPSASGPITNIFPFLGALPEWINTAKIAPRQRREREERLWTGLMRQVREEMENGTATVSYARSYFERRDAAAKDDGRSFGFDEHEAAYAVGMLCTVAIFTIGGPLYCFFLAMVLHPEWQEKCRAEIDAVVGRDRIVELSDSPNLPLLRACIKECIRWRPPVPLGVPRLVQEDDTYEGYFIPKGAVVHAIDLAMARDPTKYPDADTYNPGRWIEPEYPTYKEPLSVHPRLVGHHGFGRGRRMCPGIEITEAELLVACGSLLWAFTMKPNIGQDGKPQWPDSKAFTSNVIGGPLPFKFDLKVRDESRKTKIEELYRQSQGALED